MTSPPLGLGKRQPRMEDMMQFEVLVEFMLVKVWRTERTEPLVAMVHSTWILPDKPGVFRSSRS